MSREHRRARSLGERRKAPRGFTLAEVLVAVAVFAVVSAIALTLYAQLQKSFKSGENAASQQQNTRIAFDRLIADLRMAGFNYNPDGDGTRPDEQIEGMWQNAITIRGDFDFETSDATTPESTLGGSGMPFGIISTGNDEIVTYALGKPSGIGGTSIQFQADVSEVPRDGDLETVTINNIYLDVNSPPYTLYRIGLKPGGTPLTSIADKQPVADNIRSLTFTYYDGAGNVLTTMAGGMDTATALEQRQKIAKVAVRIVGMTRDPDREYNDPADANPLSRNYRKFELASDVTPRNLGFVGMPDLDLTDPNQPTGLSVCAGHCKGLWTTWNANSPGEGVVKYEVRYGTSVTTLGSAQDSFGTSLYLDGLDPNGSFMVAVKAVDSGGNASPPAMSGLTSMANTTVPDVPATPGATGGGNALPNAVDVTWSAPAANTTATALGCDGPPTPVRDLRGYRLYRGAASGFDPNIPSQVQASWDPNTLGGGDPDPNLMDTTVVNCRTYYYKVLAEDLCGVKSVDVATSGSATTATPPESPINLVATDLGLGQALVTWDPVTADVNGDSILIDTYKVWRASVPTGNDPNGAAYALVYDGSIPAVASPAYSDTSVPTPPPGEDIWYQVSARDDCPNESAASYPALLTSCSFGGTITLIMSPGGSTVAGTQTITVTVSGVTPTQAQLQIRNAGTGVTVFQQTSTTYPYTFTWNTAAAGPGTYLIGAAVTNSAGCTDFATTSVTVGGASVCCIVAANPSTSKNTSLGTIGGQDKNVISFDLENQCANDTEIIRIAADWRDLAGSNPEMGFWTFQGFPDVLLSPPVNRYSSGVPPIADFHLTVSPFTTYPVAAGSTATVSYGFTKSMGWKIANVRYANDLVVLYQTIDLQTCVISVFPDITNPSLVLCDPTLDPNCPVF